MRGDDFTYVSSQRSTYYCVFLGIKTRACPSDGGRHLRVCSVPGNPNLSIVSKLRVYVYGRRYSGDFFSWITI